MADALRERLNLSGKKHSNTSRPWFSAEGVIGWEVADPNGTIFDWKIKELFY